MRMGAGARGVGQDEGKGVVVCVGQIAGYGRCVCVTVCVCVFVCVLKGVVFGVCVVVCGKWVASELSISAS